MNETLSSTRTEKSRRRELAIVLVVAAAIRFLMLFFFAANLTQDPDAYRSLAKGLSRDGVYGLSQTGGEVTQPTAYRPPLYPIVLSCLEGYGTTTLRLIALLHLVMGLVTVMNTWLLANSWGIRRYCWLPAILVACDPLLLNQSTWVMTETMAAMMTTVCLMVLGRWNQKPNTINSILVGLAFAVAMLCRPTFVAWFALAGLLTLAVHRKSGRTLLQAHLALLVFVIVISPWVIRNQRVLYPANHRSPFESKPVVATTHGGYTFFLGNNDSFFDSLVDRKKQTPWGVQNADFQRELAAIHIEARGNYDATYSPSTDENGRLQLQMSESEEFPVAYLEPHIDRTFYAKALEAIRSRPLSFLNATAHRITWLWTPLGQQTLDPEPSRTRMMRWSAAAWFIAVYFFAAIGIRYQRSLSDGTHGATTLLQDSSENAAEDYSTRVHPWLYGILFCLALTVVHAFFWSNLRMRAPLIPVVSLIAAFGIEQVVLRIREVRSSTTASQDNC